MNHDCSLGHAINTNMKIKRTNFRILLLVMSAKGERRGSSMHHVAPKTRSLDRDMMESAIQT